MGNIYKDEAGHFTNKENNGGPCHHKRINGGKYEFSEDGGKTWNKYENRKAYDDDKDAEDYSFDENKEDDFGFDEGSNQYVEKCLEDISEANDKKAFEYISDNIDELTEAGLITEEESDALYAELDKRIDESGERMPLHNSKIAGDTQFADHDGQDRYETVANILDGMVGPGGYERGVEKLKEMNINVPDEVGAVDMDDDGILIGYNDDGSEELWKYDVNNQKELPVEKEPNPMDEFSGPDKEGPSYAESEAMGYEPSVDALYRPDEDKGPRESRGPADPNAPAGQVLYNSDDEEFLKDMGANLKNTQYGRQETLDEYYERVKDKHTDDMDDWKAFISTAYAMSPKEVDRYIELKNRNKAENSGIPHEPVDMPKYHKEKDHIVIEDGPRKGRYYDEQDYRESVRAESLKERLDKLEIPQGFRKRVSKVHFEEVMNKMSEEDKQKLRKQGFLLNYHGYDIDEVDGKDEYIVYKR